ncbi:GtrA family protein [Rhizobium sp. RU36D]|uniref:GtrA family protein n=1 Tax=Rhizobium sp. RU36D TaxID=1907415 RepID=UPI000A016706|nr:GtrA family protein [Rhizobium sp. RU36D]
MQKLVRFVIVGATGFAVDAAVLWLLLRFTSVGPLPARIAAIALAMTTTWMLNRSFTFGASKRSVVVEGFRYGAVGLTTAVVNYAIYAALLLSMPQLNPMAALVFASGSAMAFSFFGYSRFVFRR